MNPVSVAFYAPKSHYNQYARLNLPDLFPTPRIYLFTSTRNINRPERKENNDTRKSSSRHIATALLRLTLAKFSSTTREIRMHPISPHPLVFYSPLDVYCPEACSERMLRIFALSSDIMMDLDFKNPGTSTILIMQGVGKPARQELLVTSIFQRFGKRNKTRPVGDVWDTTGEIGWLEAPLIYVPESIRPPAIEGVRHSPERVQETPGISRSGRIGVLIGFGFGRL